MKIGEVREVSYYALPKKKQDEYMDNIFKGTAKKDLTGIDGPIIPGLFYARLILTETYFLDLEGMYKKLYNKEKLSAEDIAIITRAKEKYSVNNETMIIKIPSYKGLVTILARTGIVGVCALAGFFLIFGDDEKTDDKCIKTYLSLEDQMDIILKTTSKTQQNLNNTIKKLKECNISEIKIRDDNTYTLEELENKRDILECKIKRVTTYNKLFIEELMHSNCYDKYIKSRLDYKTDIKILDAVILYSTNVITVMEDITKINNELGQLNNVFPSCKDTKNDTMSNISNKDTSSNITFTKI